MLSSMNISMGSFVIIVQDSLNVLSFGWNGIMARGFLLEVLNIYKR